MEPVLDSSELRAIASEILAVLEAAPAVSAGSVPEERSARYAYLAGERAGQAGRRVGKCGRRRGACVKGRRRIR